MKEVQGEGKHRACRPAEGSQTLQDTRNVNMEPGAHISVYVTSAELLLVRISLVMALRLICSFLQATEKAAIAPSHFLHLQSNRA